MLAACRLAGLSALDAYYAQVRVGVQFAPRCWAAATTLTRVFS